MGAVRSFTPTAYILNDDDVFAVDLGFTFWGYTRAHVTNNGSVSFHANYVDNRTDNNLNSRAWDDLGWEYGWAMPLDPTAPFTDGQVWVYGWPWTAWVTLAPLATDYTHSGNDDESLQQVYYGFDTIGGKQAFLVTWENMCQYDLAWDNPNPVPIPRNTFQVVIYDDDTWEFNYDKVEWTHPYWWTSVSPPNLGLTETQWQVINAVGGYRMLPHANYEIFTLAYTNATGTLNVGDIISWSSDNEHGEVLSMTGDSANGEITVRLLAQTGLWESMPPGFSYERDETAYPNIQYQNGMTVTGENGWSVTGANTTMSTPILTDEFHVTEEFDWSRTLVYIDPDTYDPYQQFLDIVDSGANPLITKSNCGVPGRFVSTGTLNFVPNMVVDVTLEATLSSSLPQAEGSIDILTELPNTYLAIDNIFMDSQIDINVTTPPAQGTVKWNLVGSVDVGVTADASAVWGGLNPLTEATLSFDTDLRASYYADFTKDDLSGTYGGYWSTMGRYASGYPPWSQLSLVQELNSLGRADIVRVDQAANTSNASLGHLHSQNFLSSGQRIGGLNHSFSVDVYVPSGYPHVTLEARAGYPSSSYYFPPDSTSWPALVQSATTTAYDTWQTLTVTLPATNDQRMGAIQILSTNQTVASRWYMDNAKWRQYGPMIDTSYAERDPADPYTTDALYREYQGTSAAGGWYSNTNTMGRSYNQIRTNAYAIPGGSPSGYAFWVMTEPNASTMEAGLTNIFNIQSRTSDPGVSTKFGAWVYVPSGTPKVQMGWVYPHSYNQNGNYTYIHPMIVFAESSTHDQWEWLEMDLTNVVYRYNGVNLPSGWYTSQGSVVIKAVGQETQETDFYADDLTIWTVPRESAFVLPAMAEATGVPWPAQRQTAFADIGLSGTLMDLNLQVSGSIDVVVDMIEYSPYEEPVSGDMSFTVSLSSGQGTRQKLYPSTGNYTYGFDGDYYRYENYTYYWDYERWGTGLESGDMWFRIGGWVGGGAQGSSQSLMYAAPAFLDQPTTSYYSAQAWVPIGKKAMGLRALLWVYNTKSDIPLKVRFAGGNSGFNAAENRPNQVFSTVTTTKHGEWELITCDIAPGTVWQGSTRDGITSLHYLQIDVYSSDPGQTHVFYIDSMDFFWFTDEQVHAIASP